MGAIITLGAPQNIREAANTKAILSRNIGSKFHANASIKLNIRLEINETIYVLFPKPTQNIMYTLGLCKKMETVLSSKTVS